MRFVPALIALWLSASSALAITLEECLRLGLEQSRTAGLIAAELARQRALHGVARADFVPQVEIQRSTAGFGNESETLTKKLSSRTQVVASRESFGRFTGLRGLPDRHQVLLSQSLFVNNAIELDRGEFAWAIARLDNERRLEDYKFSVVQRFYDVLRSQERVETLSSAVDRWKRALAFAEAKFQLGTTNKIDVLNTQVNLGASENALLDAVQGLERSRDELRDLIGLPREAPAVAAEKLEFEKFENRPPSEERREVVIEKLRLKLAQANLEAAGQDRSPDVRLNTGWSDATAGQEDLVATVTYNFALGRRRQDFDYFRLQADVKASRLSLADRQAEAEREQRDVVRVLELTERSIGTASSRLAQAQESYDYSLEAFSKGLISNLDLRDSQEKLTQARDALTGLLIDYRIARRRYVKAFGGTL